MLHGVATLKVRKGAFNALNKGSGALGNEVKLSPRRGRPVKNSMKWGVNLCCETLGNLRYLAGWEGGSWPAWSTAVSKRQSHLVDPKPPQRALRLKKFNPNWSREMFNPYAWTFQSRIENFNLDWKFQSRLKISIPTLIIPHNRSLIFNLAWKFQSRLKISIWDWSLESFNPGAKSWIFSIFGPSGSFYLAMTACIGRHWKPFLSPKIAIVKNLLMPLFPPQAHTPQS